jgi:predicted kinase
MLLEVVEINAKKMPKLIILKGLPASGKSTLAKEWVLKAPKYRARINKDDIRRGLEDEGSFGPEYSKEKEKETNKIKEAGVLHCLAQGIAVVMDDTNLNPYHEKSIVRAIEERFGKNHTIDIEIKWMPTGKNMEKCLEWNEKRKGTDAYVPPEVIENMAKKWLKPEMDRPEYREPNYAGDNCYIFDIDGTLALMGDRSPYDGSRCNEDEVHTPVLSILNAIARNVLIVLLSGREEVYKYQTIEWLRAKKIGYDELYMRAKGDYRKDSIVKRELAEEHILPQYNVLGVFDDRDQVVDMWRKELKIPCFQVWYGDF